MSKKEPKTFLIGLEEIRKKLTVMLNPVKGNEKMLEDIPHTIYEDLAMFYCISELDDDGQEFGIVNNRILDIMDIDKIDLHWLALRNATERHPVKIKTLCEQLKEAAEDAGVELLPEVENDPDYLVVTNEKGVCGASAIFYPGVLAEVAERLDGSFYILPASIHEVICASERTPMSAESMKTMVTSINATNVEPKERLTDSVYYYDASLETFDKVETDESK